MIFSSIILHLLKQGLFKMDRDETATMSLFVFGLFELLFELIVLAKWIL